MLTRIKLWLEPPQFDGDEEKNNQARLMNSLCLALAGLLIIAAVIYVPLFTLQKIAVWVTILALMLLVAGCRYLLFRGQIVLGRTILAISFWLIFQGIAFFAGGIASPMLFAVAATTISFSLVFKSRVGNLLVLASILAALAVAVLEQNNYILPTYFVFTPLATWLWFTMALVFIIGTMNLVVRKLESALALAHQQNTARQHAEQSLRESEEKYRTLFTAESDAIFIVDGETGQIYEANHAAEKTYGYTRAELLSMRNLDISMQKDESLRSMRNREERVPLRLHRKKDGTIIPVEITASHVNWNGRPIRIAAIRDITERKRTEEQLLKLNECLLSFGADPMENINQLTALAGELFAADCALYNRLDEGMLCSWGQWQTPPGYNPQDNPDGHICFDVIKQGGEKPYLVRHLLETPYAQSDPNVVPYQLQTYVGQAVKFENKYVGSLCMVYQRDFVPTADQQQLIGIIASAIGVEEKRRHAELALRESEERYALAASGANDGLWDWDLIKNEIYFSPRWKSMLGYAEDQTLNTPDAWFDLIHPEDVMRVREEISRHLRGVTNCLQSEHRMRDLNGAYLWVLVRGLAIRDADNTAHRMAGSFSDVTARKRAEAQLIHDAFHDELTGLPNRALFIDRLDHAIERTHRHKAFQFAVLYLDLDHFKLVNDSLGHAIGDQLLLTSAQRLKSCVRNIDTIARLGGDEFAVLLDEVENVETVIRMTERILNELSQPFEVNGQRVFNSASSGIVMNSIPYSKPEEVLRDGEIAMYHAKSLGRACYAVFDAEMRAATLARMEIEMDLRGAIERQEFRMYYQPIVSLRDNQLVGLEALIRWQHPRYGLVLPDKFIAVAEETGLIIPIDRWTIREACRQVREWQIRFAFQSPITVHVNLSAKHFNDPTLPRTIQQTLDETELSPTSLSLEITESVLMENSHTALHTLEHLRALGIQVELDDFGTGYSSLSYLHQFPVDVLKVDRMFINQVRPDGSSPEIVETILKLGHDLGMKVVAEGLETRIQLEQLKKLGCDYGQGYYFAKPLAASAIEALLKVLQINHAVLEVS